MVDVDPVSKINYLNIGQGGQMHTSDTCFNSSAVYVTCPDLLCGTRVLTSSQLLREVGTITRYFYFTYRQEIECSFLFTEFSIRK